MRPEGITAAQLPLLYLSSLDAFVRLAFDCAYPDTALVPSAQLDIIVHALDQSLIKGPTRIVLNVPPRSLKSFVASVCLPLYAYLLHPQAKIGIVTGGQELATDLQTLLQRIISSSEFQRVFGYLGSPAGARGFRFPEGGSILFMIYGQRIIGRGFDLLVVDDPQTPTQVNHTRLRRESNRYFDDSILPRMNDADSRMVVVQQRLHEDDLSSHIGRDQGWKRLALPAVATSSATHDTRGGPVTIAKGDILNPGRLNRNDLRTILYQMGGGAFSAQYQQSPLVGDTTNDMVGRQIYQRVGPGPDDFDFVFSLATVSLAKIVDAELFGTEISFTLVEPRDLTFEEWDAYMELPAQQRGELRSRRALRDYLKSRGFSEPLWHGGD